MRRMLDWRATAASVANVRSRSSRGRRLNNVVANEVQSLEARWCLAADGLQASGQPNTGNQWTFDRGTPAYPGDQSGAFSFTAGQKVPVLMEFNEGGGGAGAALYWKNGIPGSFPNPTIIPTAFLNHEVAAV